MKIQLLNPFSISLQKNPFMEVPVKPVYSLGDFRIYKYCAKHYVHTFKNIVVAERGAINKELINAMYTNTQPSNINDTYFDFQRAREASVNGILHAQKLNFILQ